MCIFDHYFQKKKGHGIFFFFFEFYVNVALIINADLLLKN